MHMANDRSYFSKLDLFKVPETAAVGDAKQVEVLGSGQIVIESLIDNKPIRCMMDRVLFVPSLTTSLVSVGVAAKQGIVTIFEDQLCRMTKQGLAIACGQLAEGNLWVLKIEVISDNQGSALMVKEARTIDEWHQVLGHASIQRIQDLAPQSLLQTIDSEVTV